MTERADRPTTTRCQPSAPTVGRRAGGRAGGRTQTAVHFRQTANHPHEPRQSPPPKARCATTCRPRRQAPAEMHSQQIANQPHGPTEPPMRPKHGVQPRAGRGVGRSPGRIFSKSHRRPMRPDRRRTCILAAPRSPWAPRWTLFPQHTGPPGWAAGPRGAYPLHRPAATRAPRHRRAPTAPPPPFPLAPLPQPRAMLGPSNRAPARAKTYPPRVQEGAPNHAVT